MTNGVPRMSPDQVERVRAIEGIRCTACYRTLRSGEPWYEMQKTGSILCVQDMMKTTTERVAYRGQV